MRILWWLQQRGRDRGDEESHVDPIEQDRLDRAHRSLTAAKSSAPRVTSLASQIESRLAENRLGATVAAAFQEERKP